MNATDWLVCSHFNLSSMIWGNKSSRLLVVPVFVQQKLVLAIDTCLHFVRPFGENLKVLHVTATKMPFSHWLVDRALPPTLFQVDVDGIAVIDLPKTCFGFGLVQQWEPQFAADMKLIWWFFKMGDPPPYHMMRYTNRGILFLHKPTQGLGMIRM